VSVEPALASVWLVPRLNSFREQRPDIDVLIDVSPRVIDFHGGGPELALRFSAERTSWPDTEVELLLDLYDTPMLSPELLRKGPPVTGPGDLRSHILLHEENRQYWERWFEAAGAGVAEKPARGPSLADMSLVLQAALRGHGVALGCTFLARDDLASGALIAPFPIKIMAGRYWLAARSFKALAEPAQSFAAWIRREFSSAVPN
jgi:LysR family glycine cleavage system transcriptional activator